MQQRNFDTEFLIETGALDQVRDVIIAIDNKDQLTYLNKAAVQYYKIDKSTALGLKLTQIYRQTWFSPDDEHKAIISLEKEGFWLGINIQQQPDGSKAVVESAINVIKDKAGNKTGLLSIMRDITGRVDVDQWLFESNQRLKYVIEASGMMVYEINLQGKTVTIIRGIESLLGYSVGEVPSTIDWWINQIHPDDVNRATEQFYSTRAVKEVVNEYRIRNKAGHYITIQGVAKVLVDKAGNPSRIIGGMQDITKFIEMQALIDEKTLQLQNAERMSLIGQVAGMVGHDIRNPLQSIVNDTYLLKDALTTMPQSQTKAEVTESIDNIEKNISYINKIVADLLDYARPVKPEYTKINLYELVTSIFQHIAIPDNIDISIDIDTSWIFRSDNTLLRRILTNLTINAIQAMEAGGKLCLSACPHGDKALIIVEDTGVGISENVKSKLFTPLMTTKSKGQGLGLVVVKRLVEGLNGLIVFESEVGKGTKFSIELPII
jgi:PAS domain S-box-containing protein